MISEQSVLDNVFELIFADEVISLDTVSPLAGPSQVNLEMDSHEEKLHDMIQKSKEEEALRLRKAKQMQAERRACKTGIVINGTVGGGISSQL